MKKPKIDKAAILKRWHEAHREWRWAVVARLSHERSLREPPRALRRGEDGRLEEVEWEPPSEEEAAHLERKTFDAMWFGTFKLIDVTRDLLGFVKGVENRLSIREAVDSLERFAMQSRAQQRLDGSTDEPVLRDLRRLGWRLSELFPKHAAPEGLTPSEELILRELPASSAPDRELNQARIAKSARVSEGTVSRGLKNLRDQGLVEPDSLRRTPKGDRVIS